MDMISIFIQDFQGFQDNHKIRNLHNIPNILRCEGFQNNQISSFQII